MRAVQSRFTLLLTLLAGGLAWAQPELVTQFYGAELPEGLRIDRQGNMYVSLSFTRELRKIAPDGTQSTLAILPAAQGPHPFFGLHLGGVATDAKKNVYVSLATFEPDTHGIWRIAPDGTASRFVAVPVPSLPNGLVFDHRGNLLFTESFSGTIYKATPEGELSVYFHDDALLGGGPFPSVGLNGINFDHQGDLILTNSGTGTLFRLSVDAQEIPGALNVILQSPQLIGADDDALDVQGNIYVAVNGQNKVVRVKPDLSIETVASGPHVNFPASLAFGGGVRGVEWLYFCNFAPFSFFAGFPDASIMRVNVGVAGY